MKRLILTRHQKSSWESLDSTDHDRHLDDRGREGCRLIGTWLRENAYIPDQVLSSTARRCVETWEGLAKAMESDAPITYESGLYHSPPSVILKYLRRATGHTVLLTAHNPGIGEFAGRICANPPEHPRFFGYPSGATTVVEFDVDDWAKIDFGTGHCLNFAIPTELR